jgi:dTDP-4-amino-4,6-dideoxy-D-galactose acyltransferase
VPLEPADTKDEARRPIPPMQTTSPHSRATLRSLPWDSQHFGFPVACLDQPELGVLELEDSLDCARREKIKLVYWAAAPGRAISQPVLDEFGGLLVDRKATFHVDLLAAPGPVSQPISSYRIRTHPPSAPTPTVVRLAMAAGTCSRFRRDRRIPGEYFEQLYENWIVRSVFGELADVVLIADRGTSVDDPVGLITISINDGQGSIGLLAVHESARGVGIGKLLIHSAHDWLLERGVRQASVVTQLENHAACRLYEKCAYRLAHLADRYHFWP